MRINKTLVKFLKVSGIKVNIQKLTEFLYTNHKEGAQVFGPRLS